MQGSVLHPWEGAVLRGAAACASLWAQGTDRVSGWGISGLGGGLCVAGGMLHWGDVILGGRYTGGAGAAADEDRALGTKRGAEKWMLCFPSECTRFSLLVLC